MAKTQHCFCKKCKQTMKEEEFYRTNNTVKYPDGHLDICKTCITSRVNNWEPDTYKWILQECDVPYIIDEWYSLLEKYGQDVTQMTGTTIIGRYLGKMKLIQYKKYRWADTDFLQQLKESKTAASMERQGYSAAEITQTIEEQRNVIENMAADRLSGLYSSLGTEEAVVSSSDESVFEDDLTPEDKKMLRIKWGNYEPEDWVRLEQFYQDMQDSYDIQGAGHEDTLKLVCKASLKTHQLLDIGDKLVSMSPQTLLIAGNS